MWCGERIKLTRVLYDKNVQGRFYLRSLFCLDGFTDSFEAQKLHCML